MLGHADVSVVERNQSRLFGLETLGDVERTTIETRLALARVAPDECWRRLEEHCRLANSGSLPRRSSTTASCRWAIRVLNEDPEDVERGPIRENLVAFSYLAGMDLPDRDEWERDADAFDDRMMVLRDPENNPLISSWMHRAPRRAEAGKTPRACAAQARRCDPTATPACSARMSSTSSGVVDRGRPAASAGV